MRSFGLMLSKSLDKVMVRKDGVSLKVGLQNLINRICNPRGGLFIGYLNDVCGSL
jgi:hypothetical protein